MGYEIAKRVILGVVVHFMFLISIFDIYFTSPITRHIDAIPNNIPALARRVVIISVDGLRYDALFYSDTDNGEPIVPYLRSLMANQSTWGVSEAHLPTESRPGHVSMLAGFYEDPSAITKGWKKNPVDFDSIFNRSDCSFAWGSPDIVDIFFHDFKHNCQYSWTYNDSQNFAGNTMELDNWVLNEVEAFFENTDFSDILARPRNIFFLHLLGQDTSGHTHKPNTTLYRENLMNVDRIVKQIVALFERNFRDNKTAFVLSADHGMTDWGSHGTGDASEVLTPIVAWGSGIPAQTKSDLKIDQADIVPLLATLLGVPIPIHSLGHLPIEFLNMSRFLKIEALLLNANQICAGYLAKRDVVENNVKFFNYKSFKALDKAYIYNISDNIAQDIKQFKYESALDKLMTLDKDCREGMTFYHNYFQGPLFFIITLTSVCWIVLLSFTLWDIESDTSLLLNPYLMVPIFVLFNGILIIINAPITYFLYTNVCLILLFEALGKIQPALKKVSTVISLELLFSIAVLVFGVELLVLGFFRRWIYGLCMALGIICFFTELKTILRHSHNFHSWALTGLLLSFFLAWPVIGQQPKPVLPLLAGIATVFLDLITNMLHSNRRGSLFWCVLTNSLILIASCNSYFIHETFILQNTVALINQILSWLLLFLSIVLVTIPAENVFTKCKNIYLVLTIPFILLSVSHEALFLPIFSVHMENWVKLELKNEDLITPYGRRAIHNGTLKLTTARRAYMFLTYIFVAFFGIGNLASLNSFDPAWVRSFITSFSPFTIVAIAFLKILIPFLIVTLAARVLVVVLRKSPFNTFTFVLIYLNIMGINFLYLVVNEGSWLEIGSSLSHFVIQQVTIVYLILLFVLSQAMLTFDKTEAWKDHVL